MFCSLVGVSWEKDSVIKEGGARKRRKQASLQVSRVPLARRAPHAGWAVALSVLLLLRSLWRGACWQVWRSGPTGQGQAPPGDTEAPMA